MLPQHRQEFLEDMMLHLNLIGLDGGLLYRFKLKLDNAIKSVLVFSQYFSEEVCELAETLYIKEQQKIHEKNGSICSNFIPETKMSQIKSQIITDMISLVKCYNEFRSPNVDHGGILMF